MRQLNKETIQKIKEEHEKNGFTCKVEVPVIRYKTETVNNGVGKIDLCCEKKVPKIIKCWEIEDSQAQCVKNFRDLKQIQRDSIKRGYRHIKTCQMLAGENDKEVCK